MREQILKLVQGLIDERRDSINQLEAEVRALVKAKEALGIELDEEE